MANEYTESHSTILKDALVELPGVVRSVALRELRLAMREFFERSYAWTKTISGVAIPSDDTPVQFVDTGDENVEVIAILKVAIGTVADGYQDLHAMGAEPAKHEAGTKPSAWYVTSNPDEVGLHPYVSGATTDTLKAFVALIPAFDTTASENDLPRQITLKYYDAIRNGFLARMHSQPKMPYTDHALSNQLRQNFLRQIGFYAAQRKQGYNNTQNWRYPTGWSPRR